MAPEWIAARFGPPGVAHLPGAALSPTWVAAAQHALQCPQLHRLLVAVDSPMTLSRFVSNMGASFSLDRLRFSGNPVRAEQQLCSG
jgi:hypothetical protein